MRAYWLVVVVILSVGSAGCQTYLEIAVRNLSQAPVRACDDLKLEHRAHAAAREAWRQVCASTTAKFSDDYADGFQTGFADYVVNGGNGSPPAVPPFRYRLTHYESPAGHQAIEDWFEGFRQGMSAARASGLREGVIIPLSSPPINAVKAHASSAAPPLASPVEAQGPPPGSGHPAVPASPVESELPSPRPLAVPQP